MVGQCRIWFIVCVVRVAIPINTWEFYSLVTEINYDLGCGRIFQVPSCGDRTSVFHFLVL